MRINVIAPAGALVAFAGLSRQIWRQLGLTRIIRWRAGLARIGLQKLVAVAMLRWIYMIQMLQLSLSRCERRSNVTFQMPLD